MLTGTHEALYRGQARLDDYVCGECKERMIPGEIYKLTFGGNALGSFVINRIEGNGTLIIDKPESFNDSRAFRYYFEEGFVADWLIL
jgi:hypothetical protein